MINKDELGGQLEKAGKVHGHICPSLFYGVALALRGKEWLQKCSVPPEKIILEGKSRCIRDGVFSVFGEKAPISIENTGGCALSITCALDHAFKIGILPSVRLYINDLEKAVPLEEYRSKGVSFLKSLPEEELFERF